jgi:hypothetical protein
VSNEYCICTLALGEKYCLLAKQLAQDLEQFSNHPFLVLTDDPSHFYKLHNVITINHRKLSMLGYNDKLCVVQKALKVYDTCIFLDADVRILGPVFLDDELFKPGISAYRVRSWEYVVNEALSGKPAPWKSNNLRIMKQLRRTLNLHQNDSDIPYIVEFLFAVTRHKDIDSFFYQWNKVAEFCEKNKFFIHEGFSIGLAALLTGYPFSKNSFNGLRFFEPLISLQDHVPAGLIDKTEYDRLCTSIHFFKGSETNSQSGSKIIMKLNMLLRYYKIRMFGLNLLC